MCPCSWKVTGSNIYRSAGKLNYLQQLLLCPNSSLLMSQQSLSETAVDGGGMDV